MRLLIKKESYQYCTNRNSKFILKISQAYSHYQNEFQLTMYKTCSQSSLRITVFTLLLNLRFTVTTWLPKSNQEILNTTKNLHTLSRFLMITRIRKIKSSRSEERRVGKECRERWGP